MGKRAWGGVLVAVAVAASAAPAGAAGDGEVAGTVTGGGQPLAAVCVTLIGGNDDEFHFDATETDGTGRYRFVGAPAGTYGLAFQDCDADPVYAPTDLVVEVEDGEVAEQDVALERGAFIAGRVVDGTGAGLASVCVVAVEPAMAELAPFLAPTGRSTRDGTFRAGPLPSGEVVVRFEDCSGAPRHIGEWWQDADDVGSATVVVLEAGLTQAGFDVALARGGSASGTVTDPDGEPLQGACVAAADEAGDLVAGAVTAGDGTYELGGLPAGRHRVFAARCTAFAFRTAGVVGVEVDVALGEEAVVDHVVAPTALTHLAGSDRAATAADVARATATGSGTAVLARVDDPADALAAVPLAASLDAPLLLTERSRLSAPTAAVLEELGVAEVVVVGGFGAVTASVESQLRGRGVQTRRLAGQDRYATAAAVAGELGVSQAWLVSGTSWADALAVGPLAGDGAPILLTERDRLPQATKDALVGVDAVTIVGGTGVVGRAVEDQLAADVPLVARIGGRDRYETAARLLRLSAPDLAEAWVASGESWADGLVAGVAASRAAAPLVLVAGDDLGRSAPTAEVLRQGAAEIADLVVVGAVSAAVRADLEALLASR